MSYQLINHSPDLKRLRDHGFDIEIIGGHLVVRHIPYVNSSSQVEYGTLVSELTLASNERTGRPGTHVIYFQGQHPCRKDGAIISTIVHRSDSLRLGIDVQHSFSNKPAGGYSDYYAKVTRYVDIISAEAKAINPIATAQPYKPVMNTDETSPLCFIDTNSSRANIHEISKKLEGQIISIVGLGGTGAYLLDFIAKCPVKEIRLFDADLFLLHNAFRSPGSPTKELLDQQLKKVNYYQRLYSNFHKNIIAFDEYITHENLHLLDGSSYVFLAVDKGGVKKQILDYLKGQGLVFIDVGMGISKVEDQLIGILRVTTGTPEKQDHIPNRVSVIDTPEDEYNTNIQIAELNAMNASLAIAKWKKLCGFYQDLETEHHTTYSINISLLLNEDKSTGA